MIMLPESMPSRPYVLGALFEFIYRSGVAKTAMKADMLLGKNSALQLMASDSYTHTA